MTTVPQAPGEVRPVAEVTREPHLGRLTAGLMVIAVGAGLFLDQAGIAVPWRLVPAAGVVLAGLALIATLPTRHGRGRGQLVGLGAVMLVLSVLVRAGGADVSGPVGDQLITPARADWPVASHLSAGTLTLDLTREPLPPGGRLDATVGAGTIVLRLPDGRSPRIEAKVAAGQIQVDGEQVRNGLDVRWVSAPASASSAADPASAVLRLSVVTGSIEVRHGN